MQLIKVRDNKNRPVSGLDLMMSAVFGDRVPREFIAGEKYVVGEHVYMLEPDGRLLIYECLISGKYIKCGDPGWREWSLNSIIQAYADAILSLKEITSEPILYESKSLLAPRVDYAEYDGIARFVARTNNFDLNEYSGLNDIVDVYLRREHSDDYLAPVDYEFDGNLLKVEVPLSEFSKSVPFTTNFIPYDYDENGGLYEDNISNVLTTVYPDSEEYPNGELGDRYILSKSSNYVFDTEGKDYWYGEETLAKSFNFFNNRGIDMVDYDILDTAKKPAVLGYKICNLKVEAIHTVVESPLNDLQPKKVFRLDEILINGNHKNIGSEISNSTQTIKIPINIEPTRNLTDILTVTLDTEKQRISATSENGHIKQIKLSMVARKLSPLAAFIIGSKSKSNLTRFIQVINEYAKVVEIDGEKYIKFPKFDLLKHNSFDFELYHNRVFTSDYEEYVNEDGELFIKMLNEDYIDYDSDKFMFHIFYSISQGVAITRTSDTQEVLTDKDAFRIFLTTEFVNKFQWLKLREDYKLIPPEYTVGSKTSANISNMEHYVDIGKNIRADVFSLIIKNIESFRRSGSITDSCNSESYPILQNTRNLTIPFVDYDAENDDFLVFKSGGALLSSSKWYINNGDINLYIHEPPLYDGDYVDFRLLDRDSNVRIYNKFLTATSDDQEVIDIGTDVSNATFFLLFTTSGQFISPSKYTIEGSNIRFKRDCKQPFVLYNGNRLEAVFGTLKGKVTKTLYTTRQLVATEDNQKEFSIEEDLDFNIGADNVLIFREDGMYIGERFYHMSEEEDKIIIDKGTGIPLGSHIDVVIIRNLRREIYIDE